MASSMDSAESSLTSKVVGHPSGIYYMAYPDESTPTEKLANT